MARIELTRHLDAPAARVFVAVTAPDLLPEWLDLVHRVHHATGPLTAVGMSMRADLQLGPFHRDSVWRVVSVAPPRKLQLYGSSPDGGDAELTCEFGAWYGACELRLRLDHDLGPFGGRLDGLFVARLVRRHLEQSLDRLATLVAALPAAALTARTEAVGMAGGEGAEQLLVHAVEP